jgi:hypothetical protein
MGGAGRPGVSRWVLRTAAVLGAVTTMASTAVSASAAPAWAPASTATVHPGVMTHTNGAQCTSDFVFTDGSNVYLGQAAHCSGTGGSTATNGCTSPSLPLGTQVQVSGATKPGVLVYNSWLTMQARHESDPNACAFNDLALIRLDRADIGRTNPSIPYWGGPVGVNTSGAPSGSTVVSYGNSELRLGISALSPKQGVSLGDTGGGWSHTVLTATPGIPGDSGSAFLDAHGNALGILSTLDIAPMPGSNGVGDLGRELSYLHAHSSFGSVTLAHGTQAFRSAL